jgi:hypothetical protein
LVRHKGEYSRQLRNALEELAQEGPLLACLHRALFANSLDEVLAEARRANDD